MYIQEISFKELAHTSIEADKSQICRVSQQSGDPGKRFCLSSSL